MKVNASSSKVVRCIFKRKECQERMLKFLGEDFFHETP